MNTKTFEAIEKLKEVELELHRLKNALEMANKALDAQRTWVGLTDEEIVELHHEIKVQLMGTYKTEDIYRAIEAKLKEKNK
jgi:hypothetical protein